MRVMACTILAIATVLVAAPAPAQTYDPNYPVCVQTYAIGGGSIDCNQGPQGFGIKLRSVRIGPRGAVPEQSVFRAGQQETAAAPRRLLEAAASAGFGGVMPSFAHAIASTYNPANRPFCEDM